MAKNWDTSVGIKDFDRVRRQLRREFGDAGKQAAKGINRRVSDMVAEKAQTRARRLSPMSLAGNPLNRVYRRVAKSIRGSAQQTRALVRIGGARHPYAFGLEFGSKGKRQFPEFRGNQWTSAKEFPSGTGYIIQPTLRESEQQIVRMYENEYAELLDDVRGMRTGRRSR